MICLKDIGVERSSESQEHTEQEPHPCRFNVSKIVSFMHKTFQWTIFLPDCPVLHEPTNGSISNIGSVRHGDRVTISCNAGYTYTENTTRVCISGKWSGKVGKCEQGKNFCSLTKVTFEAKINSKNLHIIL